MTASENLAKRIDAEFAAMEKRMQDLQTQQVQEFQGKQQRLEQFSQTVGQLRKIWRPRLEALVEKFGSGVDVKPHIEPGHRSATLKFQSELARIKLTFGVLPDDEVRNVVFTYNLEILPILMKFESHDELEVPLDAIDESAIGNWMDDRIIGFVKTYLSLHENQQYLKDHMVEDPIAKVRFPKYAAGTTLDVDGKVIYFLNDETLREFQAKQSAK